MPPRILQAFSTEKIQLKWKLKFPRVIDSFHLLTTKNENSILTIKTIHLLDLFAAGKIQVFTGPQRKPVISADIPNIPDIKYFGFSSYDNSPAKYFYACESEEVHAEADLRKQCQYTEAMENEYREFHQITNMAGARTEGYIVNFPFYVRGVRDAHVLLTTVPVANRGTSEYEIGEKLFLF